MAAAKKVRGLAPIAEDDEDTFLSSKLVYFFLDLMIIFTLPKALISLRKHKRRKLLLNVLVKVSLDQNPQEAC